MNKFQLGQSFALTIGILVGLVIALILLRYANKNHKVRTEYDEMQKQVRNRGYMYAFYTVIILEALLCIVGGFWQIPAVPFVLHFIPIFFGVTVQASYCVWKDAYVGLNTNVKRYLIIAMAATAINILSAGMAIKNGSMVENGMLQVPAVNLMCAVMFGVLGVMLLLHNAANRGEEE